MHRAAARPSAAQRPAGPHTGGPHPGGPRPGEGGLTLPHRAEPHPHGSRDRRVHGRGLESLVQAGLSHADAQAQMVRLASGDVWGG